MAKMIAENWSVIEEIEFEVQKQIGDPEARFNADIIMLSSSPQRNLVLHVKYRKKKNDGTYTKQYYNINIVARYCPFTGKPLYEEEG